MNVFKLNNGYHVPGVGFGTWLTTDEQAAEVVKTAIAMGCRHIDTAAYYFNEKGIGQGIAECGVPREELFITSKVWSTERGYESTKKAFAKTMENLQLDYLDLYLIHWPASPNRQADWDEVNLATWRALTELYEAGKIKAIGVSNFLPYHMESLMKTRVKPMVNQIEYHPGEMKSETVEYCKRNGVLVEAWSPLGRRRILEHELLKEIAVKYNKSVAQICIRWALQNGVLPLPKSTTPSRIKENLDVFDFEITKEDMERINTMEPCGGSGLHPDEVVHQ